MFATPANPARSLDPLALWPAAPASRRDLVLIVEDEDHIAGLLTCLLERGGFRVLRAGDGAAALELLAEHRSEIALATLDGTLPDTHGGVLSRELRDRMAGLPLLFVSGRDLKEMRATLAEGGPTGFMAKPFFPAEVLRQVRALIGASV